MRMILLGGKGGTVKKELVFTNTITYCTRKSTVTYITLNTIQTFSDNLMCGKFTTQKTLKKKSSDKKEKIFTFIAQYEWLARNSFQKIYPLFYLI